MKIIFLQFSLLGGCGTDSFRWGSRQGFPLQYRRSFLLFLWVWAVGISHIAAQDYLPPLAYSAKPAVLKGKIVWPASSVNTDDTTGEVNKTSDNAPVLPAWDGKVRITYTMQYSSETGDAWRSHTVQADSQGCFRLELPVGMPHACRIKMGETAISCFVVPGDTVAFSFDRGQQAREGWEKALRFFGALSEFNRDYAYAVGKGIDPDEKFLGIEQQVNMGKPIAGLQGTDEDSYFRWLSAFRDSVDRQIEEDSRLHAVYKKYAKAKSAAWMGNFMGLCMRVLRHVKTEEEYAAYQERMRQRYEDYLKEDPFSSPLLCYGAYSSSIRWTAEEISRLTGREIELPEGLKKAMIATRFLKQMAYDQQPLLPAQLDSVREVIPELSEPVLRAHEKLLQEFAIISEGQLSRIREFPADAQEDSLLAALIAPYRGKPLLLDIWETTCGPCRLALKHLHGLKQELAGKINFVDVASVSIAGEWNGSPKDVWENLVPNVIGEHYYLTDIQGRALRKELSIRAIPVFLLIDAEGNIRRRINGLSDVGTLRRIITSVLE